MSDGRLTYQPDFVSAPGETLLDLLEERSSVRLENCKPEWSLKIE